MRSYSAARWQEAPGCSSRRERQRGQPSIPSSACGDGRARIVGDEAVSGASNFGMSGHWPLYRTRTHAEPFDGEQVFNVGYRTRSSTWSNYRRNSSGVAAAQAGLEEPSQTQSAKVRKNLGQQKTFSVSLLFCSASAKFRCSTNLQSQQSAFDRRRK